MPLRRVDDPTPHFSEFFPYQKMDPDEFIPFLMSEMDDIFMHELGCAKLPTETCRYRTYLFDEPWGDSDILHIGLKYQNGNWRGGRDRWEVYFYVCDRKGNRLCISTQDSLRMAVDRFASRRYAAELPKVLGGLLRAQVWLEQHPFEFTHKYEPFNPFELSDEAQYMRQRIAQQLAPDLRMYFTSTNHIRVYVANTFPALEGEPCAESLELHPYIVFRTMFQGRLQHGAFDRHGNIQAHHQPMCDILQKWLGSIEPIYPAKKP